MNVFGFKIHLLVWVLFGFFAKLRKATISFVMSVCPHGTTQLPLEGFFTKFDI